MHMMVMAKVTDEGGGGGGRASGQGQGEISDDDKNAPVFGYKLALHTGF
jgi:hypothetical protein